MVKINFTNAQVNDNGYGLEVNGKLLSEIISTALGTRTRGRYGYGSGLPNFESNCCNITVIIDPQPAETIINSSDGLWHSVKEMEDFICEQYEKKISQTEG